MHRNFSICETDCIHEIKISALVRSNPDVTDAMDNPFPSIPGKEQLKKPKSRIIGSLMIIVAQTNIRDPEIIEREREFLKSLQSF